METCKTQRKTEKQEFAGAVCKELYAAAVKTMRNKRLNDIHALFIHWDFSSSITL
jgi:hypothetical protein